MNFKRMLDPKTVLGILVSSSLVPLCALATSGKTHEIHLRTNQIGYLPEDSKIAVAFADRPLDGYSWEIVHMPDGERAWGPRCFGDSAGAFGRFEYHYRLDFSSFSTPGRYRVRITGTEWESLPFAIGADVYDDYHELLLRYLRKQRCGYNPFLDEVCHCKDGRTVDGPVPDGTYLDVTGGWHDAGDYLRYLLTSGNTVCRLLFAYRENRGKFGDRYDALGHPGTNGIPDVLDEARWGLDWMLKMHPAPDQLYHQVADDRDHIGWDLPHQDQSDYGWGPGSYRVVYYATGKPQGLGQYKSASTGIANLAGRYAAAMAMAADIWKNDLGDPLFAGQCLKAGREVYQLGLEQPGCQEGTPCRQPYRYHECTWADDMEWGAAELFRTTGEVRYLADARRFARLAGSISWMGADSAKHYEYYPFANLGHFALFPLVDAAFQDTLAEYYRVGIERVLKKADANPYHIGVPFIWCSNNLVAALIAQCLLYEKMTGDTSYRSFALDNRDWLLGRNPWGVSMFVGIPPAGVTPRDPHDVIAAETGREITGGLVDGPVYFSIFSSLRGVQLREPDEYELFQSSFVVYHDDLGDYATNEPTLDGTAEALFFFAYFATGPK